MIISSSGYSVTIVNHLFSGVKTLTETFLGVYLNYIVISSIKYCLSKINSHEAVLSSNGTTQ